MFKLVMMKKFVLYLFVSFLFFSCVSVEFTQPQPVGAKNLDAFPPEMQGKYYSSESDTFEIGANFYKVVSTKDDDAMLKTNIDRAFLSDSLILRKYGSQFLLNANEDGNWVVSILEMKNKNIAIGYIVGSSEELTQKLDFIKKKKIARDEDGKIDKIILTPSKKEFKMLIKKNVFEESLVLERID